MRVFAFLRGPLMAILILLALALGITPFLVRSTEDAMQRALRYDVAWIGVHGREEFHQLMRALLELPPAPGRREVEAVRQAQDIFHARLETWRRGPSNGWPSNCPMARRRWRRSSPNSRRWTGRWSACLQAGRPRRPWPGPGASSRSWSSCRAMRSRKASTT